MPPSTPDAANLELRKSAFVGNICTTPTCIPDDLDLRGFKSWNELVDAILQTFSPQPSAPCALDRAEAETRLLRHAQQQSFPEEYQLLQATKISEDRPRAVVLRNPAARSLVCDNTPGKPSSLQICSHTRRRRLLPLWLF
ncbi:uncharacterized protein V6R79_013107 [Siganus canaliculatus]